MSIEFILYLLAALFFGLDAFRVLLAGDRLVPGLEGCTLRPFVLYLNRSYN